MALLSVGMRSAPVGVFLALLACTHAAVLDVGKQRMSRKTHERPYASTSSLQRQKYTKQFLYVYDMPRKFTADIADLSPEWHSNQYDYDQVRHCCTHQVPSSPCCPVNACKRRSTATATAYAARDSHLRTKILHVHLIMPGRPCSVLLQPFSICGLAF